ncbi:MAG TPA: DUF58 domain-containing protein [Actinomycetota bacterium]
MRLTGRGLGVIGGALALWFASRILGGPDLHVVAVGLLALPGLSAGLMWRRRIDLTVRRRLSSTRVFPGTQVRVDLEVQDRGPRSLLLLEDRLPPSLGRGARAVLAGTGDRRMVAYQITARGRGRYPIGPLSVQRSDPFDLVRRREEVPGTQELVVFPEVEDLRATRTPATGAGSGDSVSRRLFRTGEEFYTVRAYEVGDDLRRIHWPSTARTGKVMIRQDEAARRSRATILLDTRVASLGGRKEVFEKAVSAAASVGIHLLRSGFTLGLSTPDLPARAMDRSHLLETLAVLEATRTSGLVHAVEDLRDPARAGEHVVVVTHLPGQAELSALSKVPGRHRVCILIPPEDPERLTEERRAELRVWIRSVRGTLTSSAWEVIILSPTGRLRDVWKLRGTNLRAAASS